MLVSPGADSVLFGWFVLATGACLYILHSREEEGLLPMKCKIFAVLLKGSLASCFCPWKSSFVPGPFLI